MDYLVTFLPLMRRNAVREISHSDSLAIIKDLSSGVCFVESRINNLPKLLID